MREAVAELSRQLPAQANAGVDDYGMALTDHVVGSKPLRAGGSPQRQQAPQEYDSGQPRYTQIWAFDRRGEKRAFEELTDFITERRKRTPRLHVYHYNHYETTAVDHLTELHETRQEAVGRLMGRFATREDEVDDLFRLGVFVDLYRVMRRGRPRRR